MIIFPKIPPIMAIAGTTEHSTKQKQNYNQLVFGTVNYTGTQSFISMLTYSLVQKHQAVFLNSN